MLARWAAARLDRRLAAGTSPEDNRVCAMFAERAESAVRLRHWRHDTRS